jgi:hypothetical protein
VRAWFLEHLANRVAAELALRNELPGQERPWVLVGLGGHPIAYFNVEETLDGEPNVHIVADVSGRSTDGEVTLVVNVLRSVQAAIGGTIADDP